MADALTTSTTNNLPDVADLTEVAGIPDFWERIRNAPHVSLFLDFDGTLAPFQADRLQAFPLPGTADALRRIISEKLAEVAFVSGRPVTEILLLMGDLGTTIVGAHGYEMHRPSGKKHVISISPEQASILDAVFAEARAIFDASRLERKAASVAAHFRGLDPREVAVVERQFERRWRAAGASKLVEFRPFNGGLELRAAGRTKGTAIEELLANAPDDSLPIYVGDDDTDEDAFRVLAGRGIGIKVGPADAVTMATGRVAHCEAVRQLLIDWPRGRGVV